MRQSTCTAGRRTPAAVFLVLVVLTLGLFRVGPLGAPATAYAAPDAGAQANADLAVSKVGLVREALSAIYGRYFNPVSGADLMFAAWETAEATAQDAGNFAPPPTPDFSGGVNSAFMRFSAGYQLLEAATPIDPTRLAYAAIGGMVDFINNCHTYFLPPASAAAQRAVLNGDDVVGTGYRRTYNDNPPWAIIYTVPNGPADRAGIKPGDSILAYDGDSSPSAPSTHIKTEGQTLTLTVQRPGEQTTRDIPITIGRYHFPRVEARIVAGNVGYIRFFTWEDSNAQSQAIRDAIANFERQGVTSWVLDVRANGGGAPEAIAKLFIGSGVIMQERMRDGGGAVLNADGSAITPPRRLAILIGPGSASASEIIPEAMRESGRAVLIGDHTEGCMAGTTEAPLSDGSSIWVTTDHVLVGTSGQDFEGIGVDPDILAPQSAEDLAFGRDPGLDAAVAYLQQTGQPAPAATP
jgi:carboxyl-terminal processing protease